MGDKNIRPERQREIEAGVDALLFNGNAVVELSVYQRTISDLLLQRALAPSTGYTTQFFNGGEVLGKQPGGIACRDAGAVLEGEDLADDTVGNAGAARAFGGHLHAITVIDAVEPGDVP